MGLVSSTIPNLINGVSQQPYALRLPSQSELQLNTYPSVVAGLLKRPASQFISRIGDQTQNPDGVFIHTINRDSAERYIVTITNGDLKVHDLAGNQKTVSFPNGKGYLSGAAPSVALGFSAVTVADYTFIVNRNVTIAKDAALSPLPAPSALIYAAIGNYGKGYTVAVSKGASSWQSTVTTPDGSNPAHAFDIATDAIMNRLVGGGTYHTGTALAAIPTFDVGWTASVAWIVSNNGQDFGLSVADGFAGQALRVFKGKVQRFTDLPAKGAPDGFTLEVVGDQSSNFDNYYVRFETIPGSVGNGVWRETIKPGIQYRLNAATMPHVLIRNSDGTFTFRQQTWEDREVGDEESAPWPSFVGRKINDVFFYRNRLGLIADENVVLSRAGSFFNFWPTTVTTVLDTDPIDVAVSHNRVVVLRHAVPFAESLLLFSNQAQFGLRSGDLLTPSTVALDQLTEFEANLQAKPVGVGRRLYFPVNRGAWSGIKEYFVRDDLQGKDAVDITPHVPTYIPANVMKIAASENEDTLLALSANDRQRLYLYRYYFGDEGKLQSSWSTWSLPADAKGVAPTILNIDCIESTLYMVVSRPSGTYLESIDLSLNGVVGVIADYHHLDMSFFLTPGIPDVITTGSGVFTNVTLPYAPHVGTVDGDTRLPCYGVVTEGQRLPAGTVVPLYSWGTANPAQLYAGGDLSGVRLVIGWPYRFLYRFSKFVLREESVGGGQATISAGRLQLRKMSISFNNTGGFFVEVSVPLGETRVYRFIGRTVGDPDFRVGETSFPSGTFEIPIQAQNTDTTITVESNDHLPLALMGAEWEGFFHARSARLGT